jgi:hypothetical protein
LLIRYRTTERLRKKKKRKVIRLDFVVIRLDLAAQSYEQVFALEGGKESQEQVADAHLQVALSLLDRGDYDGAVRALDGRGDGGMGDGILGVACFGPPYDIYINMGAYVYIVYMVADAHLQVALSLLDRGDYDGAVRALDGRGDGGMGDGILGVAFTWALQDLDDLARGSELVRAKSWRQEPGGTV